VPAAAAAACCCSELEVRKAGAPGRFILDDPKKYPAKDDIGIFREWSTRCC
jgi:hypothetical protein